MRNLKLILFILFLMLQPVIILANNDTLRKYKNQISIGTTGFYLPEFRDYNISSFYEDNVFRPNRLFISHLKYEREWNDRLAMQIEYNGFRSKNYLFIVNPFDQKYGRYSRGLTMFLFSAGCVGSIRSNIMNNLALVTKYGGGFQFRFGEERPFIVRDRSAPLDGPGVKLSISENLVYKKRYVLGINADFHAFYQPDREFQMKDHNYFMSNALYLGVKF